MQQKLLLLAVIGAIALAVNPGVLIQLNESFLAYAKTQGLAYLNKKLVNRSVSDVSGSKGILHYTLSSIHITSFNAPENKASVTTAPPNGISFDMNSVHAALHGNYHIKVGSGWLSVRKSGSFDISATASANVNTQINVANSRPLLSMKHCSSGISDLDITFHGDIIDDILDLFKSLIEHYIKDKISDMICKELSSLVTGTVNKKLQGIPVSSSIHDGFKIDYSLTGAPAATTNTIAAQFLGRIWYKGHHDDPDIPQAAPMSPVSSSSRNVCFKIDAVEVLGSGAYAGIISGKLHTDITQDLLGPHGLSDLLKCSCGILGKCIGTIIPQIKKYCQNGTVGLQIRMTDLSEMPKFVVNTTGLFASVSGQAVLKAGSTELLVLNVSASAVATDVKFSGMTISGQTHATDGTMTVASSKIGHVPDGALQTLWKLALIVIFEEEVNKLSEKGISLPKIPDVEIIKPSLQFGDRTITVCADIQFTLPARQKASQLVV